MLHFLNLHSCHTLILNGLSVQRNFVGIAILNGGASRTRSRHCETSSTRRATSPSATPSTCPPLWPAIVIRTNRSVGPFVLICPFYFHYHYLSISFFPFLPYYSLLLSNFLLMIHLFPLLVGIDEKQCFLMFRWVVCLEDHLVSAPSRKSSRRVGTG